MLYAMPANFNQMQCVQYAAGYYQVHPDLIRAIMRTEGGTTGKISWNKNGSYDMGIMQVNSIHLKELAKYGISREDLIYNPCVNIYVGTWILKLGLMKSSDFWQGVGAYNSQTPIYNQAYRYKVYKNLVHIQQLGR